jgi:RNA polymerase sigma-70 factor (ECF subfamily)
VADTERASLRQLLVSGYDDLKRRLTRRFGSSDEATEVLHETWLRVGQLAETAAIQRPDSYLYRMALNVAVDRHRASSRWFDKAELQALLHADDDQLDPERVIAMRSEIAALERRLAQLPARRRAIFLASLVEELPYREIAIRFGMSLRSVEREMSLAFDQSGEPLDARLESRSGRRRSAADSDVVRIGTARGGAVDDHGE